MEKLYTDDNWIDLNRREVECPRCQRRMNLIQNGQMLPDDLVDYLVKLMHINNSYQSYYGYFVKFNILVNVDLENNGICNT